LLGSQLLKAKLRHCRPIGSIAVGCHAVIDRLILLAAYTAAETPNSPHNCLFPRASRLHLIHGSMGPCETAPPNGISIGSAAFAMHIRVTKTQTATNRQIHRPCYVRRLYITIGRIYYLYNACDAIYNSSKHLCNNFT